MPGLISPLSASGTGATAGMKRAFGEASQPNHDQPNSKKRKIVHQLHHKQPIEQFVEPLCGGFGAVDDQEFVEVQLRRAIAIQCRGIGFASATPEAVESVAGMVHQFMTNFTDEIRKSMSTSRRTDPLAHDYMYALAVNSLAGSGKVEQNLDTGSVPPILLQPVFAPPEPTDSTPPDLEGMLGPELSGRAEKESRKYIPAHFPAFPPKHTWKSTPVYAKRECNPHTIRERAAKEGIEAEKSLRKLMEAKKKGIQDMKARRAQPKRSAVARRREQLWKDAMKEALEEEDAEENRRLEDALRRDDEGIATEIDVQIIEEDQKAKEEGRKRPNIEERMEQRVTVNYGRKFWRQAARDH